MKKVLVLTLGFVLFSYLLESVLSLPKFENGFEKRIVEEDSNLELLCLANGYGAINYTWYNTEVSIISSNSSRVFIVSDNISSSLIIENIRKSDKGMYLCTAADEHGLSSKLFSVSLANESAEVTIVQLDNVTAEVGYAALIECKAENVPHLAMAFRTQNSFVYIVHGQDGRMELSEKDDGDLRVLSLRIKPVRRSDDGLYICEAWTKFSSATKAGHLQVMFPPEVFAIPDKLLARPPFPINITCIANAIPNATISWMFENRTIISGRNGAEITGVISKSQLLVSRRYLPKNTFYGTYTCIAENALGANAVIIEVYGKEVPGPVMVTFSKMTPTSVIFKFIDPSDEYGLPITSYVVDYKIAEEDKDINTISWSKGSIYELTGLEPLTRYHFNVSGINAVGRGEYTFVDYTTGPPSIPEPPVILTKPRVLSRYSDRMNIVWLVPEDNGSPILYFVVNSSQIHSFSIQARKGIGKEEKIRNWFPNPSYELTGLLPDAYYKVEIRAVNKLGRSLPTSVVFKTNKGNITDGLQTTTVFLLVVLIGGGVVGLVILFIIVDVICFFGCRRGLLHLMIRGRCKA